MAVFDFWSYRNFVSTLQEWGCHHNSIVKVQHVTGSRTLVTVQTPWIHHWITHRTTKNVLCKQVVLYNYKYTNMITEMYVRPFWTYGLFNFIGAWTRNVVSTRLFPNWWCTTNLQTKQLNNWTQKQLTELGNIRFGHGLFNFIGAWTRNEVCTRLFPNWWCKTNLQTKQLNNWIQKQLTKLGNKSFIQVYTMLTKYSEFMSCWRGWICFESL